MPQSVVLISKRPLAIGELAKAYGDEVELRQDGAARLVGNGSWGWFAIESSESLALDFDAEELTSILQHIAAPSFALIEFRNLQSLALALPEPSECPDALVDDDQGSIIPLHEFREKLQSALDAEV